MEMWKEEMLAWTCGKLGCVCGRPCEINVKIGSLAEA